MQTTSVDVEQTFRPDTYWPVSKNTEQLLSGIKGKARRDMARRILSEEGFAGLTAFIARQELDTAERQMWGAIHPQFMGGEFLPGLQGNEVEIARISLASTTGDQISVRARSKDGKIRYSVADEYEAEFVLPFKESDRPLTLEALAGFIDNARCSEDAYTGGLVLSSLNYNYEAGVDLSELEGFVSVESSFYPGLAGYYQAVIEKWMAEREAEEAAQACE